MGFSTKNPWRKQTSNIMMKSLFLAAVVLASAQAATLKLKSPDVSYCLDGSEEWFGNIMVEVQPWPVVIATGETLTLDGGLDILQEIEVGSQLELKLTLKTAIGNLPIPCLPIDDLNIGSCTYDVQKLLDDAAALGVCDMIMAEGQECTLPLMPGSYAPFLKGSIEAQAIGYKADGTKV